MRPSVPCFLSSFRRRDSVTLFASFARKKKGLPPIPFAHSHPTKPRRALACQVNLEKRIRAVQYCNGMKVLYAIPDPSTFAMICGWSTKIYLIGSLRREAVEIWPCHIPSYKKIRGGADDTALNACGTRSGKLGWNNILDGDFCSSVRHYYADKKSHTRRSVSCWYKTQSQSYKRRRLVTSALRICLHWHTIPGKTILCEVNNTLSKTVFAVSIPL